MGNQYFSLLYFNPKYLVNVKYGLELFIIMLHAGIISLESHGELTL